MGIPGFFGFIGKYNDRATNDEKMIINKIKQLERQTEQGTQNKSHLFLDFNGAVYTALHKNKVKKKRNQYLCLLTKLF